MKISFDNPPHNIRELCEGAFDLSGAVPVFTFKDTIHNPHQAVISDHLVAHEAVHTKQQGEEPVKWWWNYLQDPEFRFAQELEAYRAQYAFAKGQIKDKNRLNKFLWSLAGDLSGSLYGGLSTHTEALRKIKDGV